ncbi:hypothetical protein LTS10_000285 [Elasticomyces elasticus]|nr:hypothetical protein LTS10_000285 [Elasticomyces elasticus]
MRVVDLRKVEWKPTALPPPDRPYPGKDGPQEAVPAVPTASPSEQTTSDVQDDPRPSEARQDEPHRRYFDPADPRRDSLRHSIFGRYARGPHPGQWDETDEDFVVQRGPLPPKIR